jgi:hypothetical protein
MVGFRNNFQDQRQPSERLAVTGGYWKAGTSFLNQFIPFVSDSMEASRNFMFYFLPTKRQLKIVKIITNHSKSSDFIINTNKKVIS